MDHNSNHNGYYANLRRSVVDEVPVGPHSVLEIGCANGRTGAALKAEGRAESVVGIELMEAAAAEARHVLDQVLVGNVEHLELPFRQDQFDVLILADVLEHLTDPWAMLRRLMRHLKPSGLIVASLPNVRNWRVLAPLLFQGKWEYEEAGILDRTHLRFFTRSGMIQLFRECGLSIRKIAPQGRKSVRFERWHMGLLSELTAVQYVIVATRTGRLGGEISDRETKPSDAGPVDRSGDGSP